LFVFCFYLRHLVVTYQTPTAEPEKNRMQQCTNDKIKEKEGRGVTTAKA